MKKRSEGEKKGEETGGNDALLRDFVSRFHIILKMICRLIIYADVIFFFRLIIVLMLNKHAVISIICSLKFKGKQVIFLPHIEKSWFFC